MVATSRRFILKAGTAGLAFSALPGMVRLAGAQTSAPLLTRYDVASDQGRAMLRIYAEAVGKMKALPASDPRSWTFQWYTHAIPGEDAAKAKADAITKVFGSVASPNRELAEAMWYTCQAHLGQPEDYFLPWHRMYVLYLEEIVRALTGRPEFTLPYWNYTGTGPNDRVLPAEFRKPTDAVWGPLFRERRNPGVNEGKPVDQGVGRTYLSDGCLSSTLYSDTPSHFVPPITGFCSNLDSNPHGALHVDVGNRTEGMGAVPWAADDPVFWVHHSNVDRFWASWNAAGGANPTIPTFLAKSFVFANGNGQPVTTVVGDVLSTQRLGYTYDKLLPRPPGSPAFPPQPAVLPPVPAISLRAFSQEVTAHTKTAGGAIRLGALPTAVALAAAATKKAAGAKATALFSTQMAADGPGTAYFLQFDDLSAASPTGNGYDIYLDLPLGKLPSREDPSFVGGINFFNASHAHHGVSTPRSYSLMVTEAVNRLKATGRLTEAPSVLLVPTGDPAAGSEPKVGAVRLIAV
ncbi:tyrosinase family protein [Nitrospirillum sp. BR 11828]|uniref:tyrosinase family protein n=1 Tax=Nitrospirillum sp. BR 11828 TaxID=3104325 RepID=UPI002ACAA9D8|nr:tyrosinase family protein [Nitrospirillum sp. BR 11828]MDZ5648837.1 tyrosinase family protein [Nitrospirillum sp. BR 11828]